MVSKEVNKSDRKATAPFCNPEQGKGRVYFWVFVFSRQKLSTGART